MTKPGPSIADPPPIREWEEAAAKVASQYTKGVDLTSDGWVALYRQIPNLKVWELRAVAESLFMEMLQLRAKRGDDRELAKEALKEIEKFHNDRKRGAETKKAKDPKQAAKVEAFREWECWVSGTSIHKYGADFARHIVEKFPVLTDTKSVERWVTKWRRESEKMKSEK